MAETIARTTAVVLAGLGGLHAAWGLGSSFPLRTRDDLADTVVGREVVPPPAACAAVAAALVTAATLVGVPSLWPRRLRRAGVVTLAGVLGARGVLGVAGAIELVSPGSTSPRFTRLNRRYYSPLCLALAAGSLTALSSAPRARAPRGASRR